MTDTTDITITIIILVVAAVLLGVFIGLKFTNRFNGKRLHEARMYLRQMHNASNRQGY